MKVEELKEPVFLKVVTHAEEDPKKACVDIVKVTPQHGFKSAEVLSSRPDSYFKLGKGSRFDIDQEWLDNRQVATITVEESQSNSLKNSILEFIIESVTKQNGFHNTHHTKFDAGAESDYFPAVEARNLQVAKLESPFSVSLNNDRAISVTHISNFGELIYNAKELKSIPYDQISPQGVHDLALALKEHKVTLAPTIEAYLTNPQEKVAKDLKSPSSPSM